MFNLRPPMVFEPSDLALLSKLFTECCNAAIDSQLTPLSKSQDEALKLALAKSLIGSMEHGERDPETMKQVALQTVLKR